MVGFRFKTINYDSDYLSGYYDVGTGVISCSYFESNKDLIISIMPENVNWVIL